VRKVALGSSCQVVELVLVGKRKRKKKIVWKAHKWRWACLCKLPQNHNMLWIRWKNMPTWK